MAESTTPPEAPPETTTRARSRALVAIILGVAAFWFCHRTQWSTVWSVGEASFIHHAFREGGLVPGPSLPSAATTPQAATLGHVMELVGATPETLRAFLLFVVLVLAAATIEGFRRSGMAVALAVVGWLLASREILGVDFVSPIWIAAALAGVARLVTYDGPDWSTARLALGLFGAAGLACFSPAGAAGLSVVLVVDAMTARSGRARVASILGAAVSAGLAFIMDRGVFARLQFGSGSTISWASLPSLPWTPPSLQWIPVVVLAGAGAAAVVLGAKADRRRHVGRIVVLACLGGAAMLVSPASRDAFITPVWLAAAAAVVGSCVSTVPPAVAWTLAVVVLGYHVEIGRSPPAPVERPDAVLALESARASRLPATGLVVSGDLRIAVAVAARTGHNPGMPVVSVPEDAELGGLAAVCRQLGLQRVWIIPAPDAPPPGLILAPSPVRGPPGSAHFVVAPR